MTSIQFQVSHVGWVVLTLVLALAAAGLVWRSRLSWPGRDWVAWTAPALKLLGLLLLLSLLLNPVMTGKEARKGANSFVVLVDSGHSMALHAGDGFLAGLKSAQETPGSWLAQLEDEFRVERFVFSNQIGKWPETGIAGFEGERSDLVRALQQVKQRFAKRPLAGVLVFSDGLITDRELVGSMDLGFRVFPVLCRAEKPVADVGIRGVTSHASDFEDAPVTMTVSLRSEHLQGGKVNLTVRDERGETVAREEHAITAEVEDHVFQARFRPLQPGVAAYRVEAALQGETVDGTSRNNAWMESIDRGRGPYRVLYVSGRPNWDHKFLSRAVAGDPEVQLAGLVRVAKREPKFVWRGRRGETGNPLFRGFQDPAQEEELPGHDQPVFLRLNREDADELRAGFPRERAELFGRYHAVVVDDLEAEFFSEEQQMLLEKFVSLRGGSLLMLGGQESLELGGYRRTTIGQMLPVYLDEASPEPPLEEARLDLTREGWLEPWVRLRLTESEEEQRLALMPPFRSVHRLESVKPGASILAMASGGQTGVPGLVTQTYGEGRVAVLGLGDVWRWGMKDEAQRADMERWWRQVMRWLVADVPRFVELETAWDDEPLAIRGVQVRVRRKDFRPEENATVELLLREAGQSGEGNGAAPLRLFAEPSLEEPGLYQARVPVTRPGAWLLEAVVTGEGGERIGQGEAGWSWNPAGAELASLQATPEVLQQIATQTGGKLVRREDLQAFVRELPRMEMPIEETWVRPVWHRPWLLLVVLALFLGEWALRRWRGRA